MRLDDLLVFSDQQAVSAAGLSARVSNIFANGQPNTRVDLGIGEPVWLVVQLAKTNTAVSGTLKVALQTSDTSDMASPVTLSESGEVDIAELDDGRIGVVLMPSAGYKKYLGLHYTPGSATGLVVDAFIVKDLQANTPYKSGFTTR